MKRLLSVSLLLVALAVLVIAIATTACRVQRLPLATPVPTPTTTPTPMPTPTTCPPSPLGGNEKYPFKWERDAFPESFYVFLRTEEGEIRFLVEKIEVGDWDPTGWVFRLSAGGLDFQPTVISGWTVRPGMWNGVYIKSLKGAEEVAVPWFPLFAAVANEEEKLELEPLGSASFDFRFLLADAK